MANDWELIPLDKEKGVKILEDLLQMSEKEEIYPLQVGIKVEERETEASKRGDTNGWIHMMKYGYMDINFRFWRP